MEVDGRRSNPRFAIWRSAIFFTPIAVLTGLILLYLIIDRLRGGQTSSLVFILIVLVTFLLVGWQAVQAIRDLWATPVTTTGQVKRKWSRPLLFFIGRSFYIHVDKYVFSINQIDWTGLQLGDTVAVRHYPHTWTVLDVQRVPPSEAGGAGTRQ